MEFGGMDLAAFGRENVVIKKFLLYPSTTEYKEVGKRTFTTTRNVEERIEDAVNWSGLDARISTNSIVNKDLDLVKLTDSCQEALSIEGGIELPRYVFVLVVEERNMSGNIVRTFLKGYTSPIELSLNHGGKFSYAVPDETLFYIDSVSTVTIAKTVRNQSAHYVVTDDHHSDHVIRSDRDVKMSVMRPVDSAMANYIKEHSFDVGTTEYPNILEKGNDEKLSSKQNGSTTLYTKKLIDGVLSTMHDTVTGYGSDQGTDSPLISRKDIYGNLTERDLTDVPFLSQLAMFSQGGETTVLSVHDLKRILNVYSLNDLVEVIQHKVSDIELNALTMSDVDNLGKDTITVGVHDMFNNIQSILSSFGVLALEFQAFINTYGMDNKYTVAITNFDTIYGNSVHDAKLEFMIHNLKNAIINLALEPLDKFMRFDEYVASAGMYTITVNYTEFTDCIVTLEFGNERLVYRYPTFASAALSPVVSRDISNTTLLGISRTLENVTSGVMKVQEARTRDKRRNEEFNYFNPNAGYDEDEDDRNYYPDDEQETPSEVSYGF